MISDPLFYAAAIPAVILLGISKGGFAGIGALSLPLLALVISPIKGAAIMLPILMIQDVVSVRAYWRQWDKRVLKPMIPGALAGIILAYLVAAYISDAVFELVLGLISVIFAVRHLLKGDDVPATQPSNAAGFVWGGASGFTSMIANSGGPPFQIYVTPQKLPRDVFVGTMTIFFFTINWLKVIPFIALGQFTSQNLLTSVVLFPLAILSTWAGIWLVQRVPGEETFYRIIYVLMVVVGVKLIWDGSVVLLAGA